METGSIFALPNDDCPSLSFDKDDFMNPTFNVDKFVSEHRKHASLERLRDDLSIYLKILKSAMVELINHDYADFVNLSTNLAGLDKSINNLCIPLGQLKEEVMSVKAALDEALKRAHALTKHQQEMRNRKLTLQRVTAVIKGVDKLEKLYKMSTLSANESKSKQQKHSEIIVERIANELMQVQFHLSKIPNLPIGEQMKPKISEMNGFLEEYLESLFLDSFQSHNTRQLQFVLRICVTIGFVKKIQTLFQKKIVHPYMTEVITDKNLKKDKGISRIYADVLQFLPLKCKQLIEVTTSESNLPETICGYNFLVDVIWPDVVSCLETRTPIIFSPGSPDHFHRNYLASMDFIQQFEEFCPNPEVVERLRNSASYVSFISKWNLPVYFQIRFPKIAGTFETALTEEMLPVKDSDFCLKSSEVLMSSIRQCWSKEVFLPALTYRFLKLTLQLISRYCTWVEQVTAKESKSASTTSNSVTDDSKETNSNISNGPVNSNNTRGPNVVQLVMLVKDILALLLKVPLFFEEIVYPIIESQGFSNVSLVKDGLSDNMNNVSNLPEKIGSVVISHFAIQCSHHLRNATDIPRLYRKTNREVPSKPSNYVGSLFFPMETFLESNRNNLPDETLKLWSKEVIDQVTLQYLKVTRDVLHQVKRVEDSLKILKKAREKTPTGITGNANSSGILTDDDKIRLQLSIDIEHYGQKIENLGLKPTVFSTYSQLVEIVESARNSPSGNS